jgi:hypothetical protein
VTARHIPRASRTRYAAASSGVWAFSMVAHQGREASVSNQSWAHRGDQLIAAFGRVAMVAGKHLHRGDLVDLGGDVDPLRPPFLRVAAGFHGLHVGFHRSVDVVQRHR